MSSPRSGREIRRLRRLGNAGTVCEHHRGTQSVRTSVGLFDVSHMGEIEIRGPRALEVVQRLTSNDAAKLAVYQVNTPPCVIHMGGLSMI